MIEIVCKSICDRCGVVDERRSTLPKLPIMWSRIKMVTKWVDNMEYEKQETERILCVKCSEEFQDWYQNEKPHD